MNDWIRAQAGRGQGQPEPEPGPTEQQIRDYADFAGWTLGEARQALARQPTPSTAKGNAGSGTGTRSNVRPVSMNDFIRQAVWSKRP